MKKILLLVFILTTIQLFGQNYMFRPYLELSDSTTLKTFRIKPKKTIDIKLNNDQWFVKTSIQTFLNYSMIVLKTKDTICLSQIDEITFNPEIPKRTFKQVSYLSFYSGFVAFQSYMYFLVSREMSTMFFILGFTFVQPLWILGTELYGWLIKAYTPSIMMNRNTHIQLKIICQ